MLSSMRLVNFKSWADTGSIKLAPITGFFGPNSSGKTSLLQSLLLLKQTAASSDRNQILYFGTADSLVDLGSFESVVHGQGPESELCMELVWKLGSALAVVDPFDQKTKVVESRNIQFRTNVKAENGGGSAMRLIVPELSYTLADTSFGLRRRTGTKNEYDLYADGTAFQFRRTQGRAWPLPPQTKCYGFPDQTRAYYQNAGFLSDLELSLEQQLKSVFYLGPLRAYPERSYTWAGSTPSDMGREGELAIDALLLSRDRKQTVKQGKGKKRQTLEEHVASWLKRLGLIAEFRVKAVAAGSQIYQVLVKKNRYAPEVLITDVGFGVSQILPVIVLCFYVPEGSTIILEQPEIHLHPSVQAGLADVLIDAVDKHKVQVILESHSEHLLRRLQRRIADESVSRDDIALYFCESIGESSSITTLDLDPLGNIVNWPQEFFGDQFGEMAATQMARLDRMKTEAAK